MHFNEWLMIFGLSFLSLHGYLYEEPWGKDADLRAPQKTAVSLKDPSLSVKMAHGVIRFHQNVISPVDGPRSSFRPSSSNYMKLAMDNYGFVQGLLMGFDRLMRENSDEWVYRTIEDGGQIFKYDPAFIDKYR